MPVAPAPAVDASMVRAAPAAAVALGVAPAVAPAVSPSVRSSGALGAGVVAATRASQARTSALRAASGSLVTTSPPGGRAGHGVPEPSPPTAEEVAEGAGSRPQCPICLDQMYRSQDIVAQWCGHSFHRFCMMEWRVQCNEAENACPFRCQRSTAVQR